jgi:hypothetical protein
MVFKQNSFALFIAEDTSLFKYLINIFIGLSERGGGDNITKISAFF